MGQRTIKGAAQQKRAHLQLGHQGGNIKVVCWDRSPDPPGGYPDPPGVYPDQTPPGGVTQTGPPRGVPRPDPRGGGYPDWEPPQGEYPDQTPRGVGGYPDPPRGVGTWTGPPQGVRRPDPPPHPPGGVPGLDPLPPRGYPDQTPQGGYPDPRGGGPVRVHPRGVWVPPRREGAR